MARKDIGMTAQEVATFLARHSQVQVATLGNDGWPHLTTLWYVMVDGRLRFRSFAKSRRIRNLRADSRLAVLVESGVAYEDLQGVMIKGRAVLEDDPRLVLDTYRRVVSVRQGIDASPEAIEQMYGRHAAKNVVVTVDPVEITSWDHHKLSGAY